MTRARTNTDNELVNLRINLEEAKNENVTILQELEKTRLKLASVERVAAEKELLVKKLEESSRQDTSKDTIGDTYNDASKDTSANSSNQDTFDSLRNRLKALEAENAQLKAKYASRENTMDKAQLPQPLEGESVGDRISSDLPISSSSSSLILDSPSSLLEQSLEEAESRIVGLLSVKDRLVTVQES